MNLRMQASFPYFSGRINLEAYKSFSEVKEVNTLVAQLCLTLCDPMDCSLPDSSVHGILQARILEWVAMPSSRMDLPYPGVKPGSPALQAGSLPLSYLRRPQNLSQFSSVQFSHSVVSDSLCDPMKSSKPGLPVNHQLLEFTQTHVH